MSIELPELEAREAEALVRMADQQGVGSGLGMDWMERLEGLQVVRLMGGGALLSGEKLQAWELTALGWMCAGAALQAAKETAHEFAGDGPDNGCDHKECDQPAEPAANLA